MIPSGPLERFHRVHGDIVASFAYVREERAMILWPKNRKATPFIVCESAAWKYDEPEYLARVAKEVCSLWGMADSTTTWYRVANIINESLPDLIRMKPYPSRLPEEYPKSPIIGEATLMADGKPIITHPIPATVDPEWEDMVRQDAH